MSKLATPLKELEAIQPETIGSAIVEGLKKLMASKTQLLSMRLEAQKQLADLKTFKVETQEHLDLAKSAIDEVQTLSKARTAEKEAITQPLFRITKLIHDIHREEFTAYEGIERLLKQRASEGLKYLTKKQTELLLAAGAAARQGNLETARTALAQAPNAELPKGLNMRPVWKYRIVRPELVPDAFLKLVVDEDKLKAAIEAGTRQVAGVEIYEEDIVSNRR